MVPPSPGGPVAWPEPRGAWADKGASHGKTRRLARQPCPVPLPGERHTMQAIFYL